LYKLEKRARKKHSCSETRGGCTLGGEPSRPAGGEEAPVDGYELSEEVSAAETTERLRRGHRAMERAGLRAAGAPGSVSSDTLPGKVFRYQGSLLQEDGGGGSGCERSTLQVRNVVGKKNIVWAVIPQAVCYGGRDSLL